VRGPARNLLPLSAVDSSCPGKEATAINCQSQSPAITLSFDLAEVKLLSDAAAAMDDA